MEFQAIEQPKVQMAMPLLQVIANIRASERMGLPQIEGLSEWREGRPLALVGGGPSLASTIDELRAFGETHDTVMICGSAHDYVVKQGIRPRWTVISDPDPVMANYLRHPCDATTYLVASYCSREIYHALADMFVVNWNCADGSRDPEIWGDTPKLLINGGCTVFTRAMMIALCFGYLDLHLFGIDNCVGERHHAYEFSTSKEEIGRLTPIRIEEGGRTFMMADYMVAQLFDFKAMLTHQGHRCKVTVHGDGALAELMAIGRRKAAALKEAA